MVRPGMCILKVSFIVFSLAGVASSQQLPATDAQAAEIVSRNVPGFRLAEPGDFVPELHEVSFVDSATQSAFSADFDQDGRDDWADLRRRDAGTGQRPGHARSWRQFPDVGERCRLPAARRRQ
jgi:hypothetical protein